MTYVTTKNRSISTVSRGTEYSVWISRKKPAIYCSSRLLSKEGRKMERRCFSQEIHLSWCKKEDFTRCLLCVESHHKKECLSCEVGSQTR